MGTKLLIASIVAALGVRPFQIHSIFKILSNKSNLNYAMQKIVAIKKFQKPLLEDLRGNFFLNYRLVETFFEKHLELRWFTP